ncbi:MAG: outer membrane lipoprotein carrier protein LolA [Deinococcales bacterium]
MKKYVFLAGLAAFATLALAQAAPTVDDLIKRLEAAQKTTKDFRSKITGSVEQDGKPIKIEATIAGIVDKKLSRIEFLAPDTLADNILIVDNQNVFNYLFLTNQVTISKSSSGTEVGGFNFNPNQLNDFDTAFPRANLNFAPVKAENSNFGKTWLVEATPKKKGDFEYAKVRIWVLDSPARVVRFQSFDEKGASQIDIQIPEWKTNQNLKIADLCKLPKDAEIIRKGSGLKKNNCNI